MRGKAGVRPGLLALGRVGESPRGGGWGNVLGLGISSDGDMPVVEGFWIGRPNESSLRLAYIWLLQALQALLRSGDQSELLRYYLYFACVGAVPQMVVLAC